MPVVDEPAENDPARGNAAGREAPPASSAAADRVRPASRASLRAAPARALTLSRVVGLPPFLWLLVTAAPGSGEAGALVVAYVCFALSDFLDGPLARRAGTADPRWGQIDVGADVLFNAASLGAAAARGLVGVWVPLGVAVLGIRFLARVFRSKDGEARRVEDPAGKVAGVLYYGLVALVVFEVATGAAGPTIVARAGDAAFLYTAWLLIRSR